MRSSALTRRAWLRLSLSLLAAPPLMGAAPASRDAWRIPADARARDLVASLHPGRRVFQLDIDALAAGGGGIHCMIPQRPA